MSSCLRMALAFSTATSSAKLKSSVGDLVFKSCSFISCMRCYSKRGWVNLGVSNAARGRAAAREGERMCLGGKAEFDACSAPGDPIFWGERRGRDSVPNWMRLIL